MTVPATTRFEFNETLHKYTVDGVEVPSVTQILSSAGLVDYAGISQETLRYAAERGTAVHLACQFYDEEDLDPESLDLQVAKYVAAWRQFRLKHDFEILGSEQMHLGELNGLQFGMTIDRLIEWRGRRAILDIKCSSRIHRWCGVQTAGYAIGLESHGTAAQRLSLYRRLIVQLKPNCTYELYDCEDTEDGEIFAAALAISHWKLRSNGRVL